MPPASHGEAEASLGLERQISLRCKSHISAAARRCRATLLSFGRVAVQAGQAQRRYCALLFPPFRSASGADIAACAVCVMLPAGAATLARFLEGSHRNVLGRVSANTGRSGRSSASATPSTNVGKGKASGKKGVWARFSGALFEARTPFADFLAALQSLAC